jgi:hypothetical protein
LDEDKTRLEVVSMLLERFPEVNSLISSPDKLEESTIVYERFIGHVAERAGDEAFLGAVGEFISDLAECGDPLVQDVLVISIFENLVGNPAQADKISPQYE